MKRGFGGFFARAGIDYHLTDKHTLSLSGFGMAGNGYSESLIDYKYVNLSNALLSRNYNRANTGDGDRPSINVSLDYKFDIDTKGSNLMYDAQREAEATMFGREMRDPRSAQELLDEALSVASQADVIVAAVGESSEMSGESSSRTNLEMPDAQRDLLTALKKTGKPIVLVYFAGRSTVMTWNRKISRLY
jgi:hypothetical protein